MSEVVANNDQPPFVGVPKEALAWVKPDIKDDDPIEVIFWLDSDYQWHGFVNQANRVHVPESVLEALSKSCEIGCEIISYQQNEMSSASLGDPVEWRLLHAMESFDWNCKGGSVAREKLSNEPVIY